MLRMGKARPGGKHIGRPSISPKVQKRIAERIAAGETPHTAAKYGRPFEVSAAA